MESSNVTKHAYSRRHGARTTRSQQRVLVVLALVFVPLLLVSLWPDRLDDASYISAVLDVLHSSGLPEWVKYSTVERLANMALYVPVGAALAVAFGPRRWWVALGVAIATSIAFESVQNLLASRSPSWLDILMNALGALAGTALVMTFNERRVRVIRPIEPREPAPTPPTGSRLEG